ncbi:MAG: hypothetical protein AB1400_07935 [Pseudomonadota bacterium]|jgi:hypothetical protein
MKFVLGTIIAACAILAVYFWEYKANKRAAFFGVASAGAALTLLGSVFAH